MVVSPGLYCWVERLKSKRNFKNPLWMFLQEGMSLLDGERKINIDAKKCPSFDRAGTHNWKDPTCCSHHLAFGGGVGTPWEVLLETSNYLGRYIWKAWDWILTAAIEPLCCCCHWNIRNFLLGCIDFF